MLSERSFDVKFVLTVRKGIREACKIADDLRQKSYERDELLDAGVEATTVMSVNKLALSCAMQRLNT